MGKTIYDEAIFAEQRQQALVATLKRGLYRLTRTKAGNVLFITFTACVISSWVFRYSVYKIFSPCAALYILWEVLHILSFPVISFLLIYLCGFSPQFNQISRDLKRAGLVNAVGEPPTVLYKKKHFNPDCEIWFFDSKGIAPIMWQEKIPVIQSALNINVADVKEGKDRRTIELWGVSPDTVLNEQIPWSDEFINTDNDAIITLGKSYLGNITYNCDINNSACIMGSSGSGKSTLLKSIIHQMESTGWLIFLTDMKHSADFKKFSNDICMAYSQEETLNVLNFIAEEMNRRQKLFYDLGVVKISEYRKLTGEQLPRIVYICDEVAELLVKTNNKDHKQLIENIEERISLLTRMGRSFGISVILSGQRLDSNTLSGQIRANLDIKIAGRCDSVLSQLIFNDTRAHDMIPKSSVGLFINQDNVVFKGFI